MAVLQCPRAYLRYHYCHPFASHWASVLSSTFVSTCIRPSNDLARFSEMIEKQKTPVNRKGTCCLVVGRKEEEGLEGERRRLSVLSQPPNIL